MSNLQVPKTMNDYLDEFRNINFTDQPVDANNVTQMLNTTKKRFKLSNAVIAAIVGGGARNITEEIKTDQAIRIAVQKLCSQQCYNFLFDIHGSRERLGFGSPRSGRIVIPNVSTTYLLLKHRAKHDIEANDSKRPIDIAVDKANADIVTLLRLTKLHEEIGVEEQGNGESDTYNHVMRDFSQMAVNQPQRLQRNPKTNDPCDDYVEND